jgi:hypothetical protein
MVGCENRQNSDIPLARWPMLEGIQAIRGQSTMMVVPMAGHHFSMKMMTNLMVFLLK